MTPKKRILVFSPPFSGHINVLKNLITEHGDSADFKLVITGWKNISANLKGLTSSPVTIAKSDLKESDPALWTLPRVVEQLDECLEIARAFNPNLILYDFFSVEGRLVGALLGIPYWCSIPALVGPFENRGYLNDRLASPINQEALLAIQTKFGGIINQNEIEMISDGLHLPGQINIVWSYPSITPPEFRKNRASVPYIFVGNPGEEQKAENKTEHPRPKIYLSFGTVVMNNLWNQQKETRQKLTAFMSALTELWKDRPWDVTFASQGKMVLDSFPDNWKVVDTTDQPQELSETDVFVTHGGSNSFHEAILGKVPMVAVPFFGDQPLVARRIQELGLGISFSSDPNIDTRKSKDFLDKKLAEHLDQAVVSILGDGAYKDAFNRLDLIHTGIKNLLEGRIPFSEGDLLFGTNTARKKYVDETSSQEEFKILEFKAFSELVSHENALPRIVDIYHDAILNDDYFKKDIHSNLKPYAELLGKYKEHLGGASDFLTMCTKGLDFFSQFYNIHFILSDYDPATNYITTKEIGHVIQHGDRFKKSVIFYKKIAEAWVPTSHEEVAEEYIK